MAGQRTKDYTLTVPLEHQHEELIRLEAEKEGRAVAGWARWVLLQELQRRGLVDEDFDAVKGPT